MENNADNAYPHNATATGAVRHEYEPNYNMQIVCYIEEEDANRGDLVNIEVFKSTSGNATKRLRVLQETRRITKTTTTYWWSTHTIYLISLYYYVLEIH